MGAPGKVPSAVTKYRTKDRKTPAVLSDEIRLPIISRKTGQWNGCRTNSAHEKMKNTHNFKNSAAKECLKLELALDDLMNVVNKESCFAKETDKQEKMSRKKPQSTL